MEIIFFSGWLFLVLPERHPCCNTGFKNYSTLSDYSCWKSPLVHSPEWLPGQFASAGSKRLCFNSYIIEHAHEQIAEWSVVPPVVGNVSAVIVAAAGKDDR